MSPSPGTKLAHYEILEPIGKGGMGEVYRAKDSKLGRDVAIKVLPDELAKDEERLRRFRREAKVLASLNHPNIAAIYGLEQSDETHYLVLELVPGETLAARIARGPIPLEEALLISAKIAEALEAAHERGIVHRDLKPANIMLTPDDNVKVLDFGLAKAFVDETPEGDSSLSSTLARDATRVGVILGTAAYMSPEQAKGKQVDKRTDIFAFGAVAYEMLTGSKAFPGDDVGEVLASVIKVEPDWTTLPTSVPAQLVVHVRRCLDKDPRRRVRDIGEARILMEDALAGSLVAYESRSNQAKRTPWGWMAVAAALLLSLVAVLFFGRHDPSNEGVLRYSIPLLQDGLTFSYALSPNGRHAAFRAVKENLAQIYVRALDSWDLQPLPGTIGVTNLFWPPDSLYIAFFAREKLWKVAVNGGPAEALCDVPGHFWGASGTWGRNDVIIFSPSTRYGPDQLRSVSAAGGMSSPLSVAEPAERHRFPVFLPDGNHFLYTRVGGTSSGIYVASLDEASGRRLLADTSSAHLAPAPDARGVTHLLFIRNGDLMAQEFDTDRRDLTGEPFVLLDDAPRLDGGAAAVSVSENGILSYFDGRDRSTDSRFTWFERSGDVISDEGGFGPPASVSLSPDEKTMAVPLRPPELFETTDLHLRDLTRGVDERLTFDGTVKCR